MSDDCNKPCVYFYIDDKKQIAYVGQSNGRLKRRIAEHTKQKKFIEANSEFEIRYQIFESFLDMDFAEREYIKTLKPYLNFANTKSKECSEMKIDIEKLPILEVKKEQNREQRRRRYVLIPDAINYFITNVIPYLPYMYKIKSYKNIVRGHFTQYDYVLSLEFHKICEFELERLFYTLFPSSSLYLTEEVDEYRVFAILIWMPILRILERHKTVQINEISEKRMTYHVSNDSNYCKVGRYFLKKISNLINDVNPPYSWFEGIDILIDVFKGNYEKIEIVWAEAENDISNYTDANEW